MNRETKLTRIAPLVAALAGLVSAPAPASADCLLDYANCVDAASELDSFGRRSLAGLRCYTNLISCLQRLLD